MPSRVILLAFVFGMASASAHAQALRGRLVDAESGAPVVGALVVLRNSAGTRVAQSVSSGSGRFQVQAPSAGSYSLRVLRIGYQPYEVTRRFDGTAPSEETIRLSGMPVALPEIAVAGSSKCGERALGDTLSSAIWTQAGTALAITAQTVRSRSYRFQTALEQRQVDLVGTTSTPAVTNELGISAWPVRSPPPDTLLASGFVENLEDLQVGPTWYGPDPEFLLSDPFFAGHCFRAVPADSSSEAGWVGLAFEPAARDMRADIRGTLWLDRATAELRRLEFEYTRLPRWARGSEAGGTLAFAPLPEGGWIVQKWMIRVPVPEVEVATGRAKVLGYRESGGHVVAVLDASGVVLQRYPQ